MFHNGAAVYSHFHFKTLTFFIYSFLIKAMLIILFNYHLYNFIVSYFTVKSFSRCGYRITDLLMSSENKNTLNRLP